MPSACKFNYKDLDYDETKTFLFIADVHYDSIHCDRKLLASHFKYCKENNIDVFVLGDWFDVMQTERDPRTSKSELAHNHKKDAYLNSIVMESAEFLEKYPVVKFMSVGNHESVITRKLNIDLIEYLNAFVPFQRGDYRGFINVGLRQKCGNGKIFHIYYTHGKGAGAEVTRGTIQTNRRDSSIEADLYVSGHLHDSFLITSNKWKSDNTGNVSVKYAKHLQVGTYLKSESQYSDMKEHRPHSRGGWLVKFENRYVEGKKRWVYNAQPLEW